MLIHTCFSETLPPTSWQKISADLFEGTPRCLQQLLRSEKYTNPYTKFLISFTRLSIALVAGTQQSSSAGNWRQCQLHAKFFPWRKSFPCGRTAPQLEITNTYTLFQLHLWVCALWCPGSRFEGKLFLQADYTAAKRNKTIQVRMQEKHSSTIW